MRALFALLFLMFAFACGVDCKISSQCGTGEHCDFTRGECVKGCEQQADCPNNSTCDVATGLCELPDIGRRDTGVATTTTSTTPDASAGD